MQQSLLIQNATGFYFIFLPQWLDTFPLGLARGPTEDSIRLKRSRKRRMGEKKWRPKWGERKSYNPPWCPQWHSRLNIILWITTSVADRLVGRWLERSCLPVRRRSRPHTLLTSATEQQTMQRLRSLMGGSPQDMTWHTHSYTHTLKSNMHAVFNRECKFFYIPLITLFVLQFSTEASWEPRRYRWSWSWVVDSSDYAI